MQSDIIILLPAGVFIDPPDPKGSGIVQRNDPCHVVRTPGDNRNLRSLTLEHNRSNAGVDDGPDVCVLVRGPAHEIRVVRTEGGLDVEGRLFVTREESDWKMKKTCYL